MKFTNDFIVVKEDLTTHNGIIITNGKIHKKVSLYAIKDCNGPIIDYDNPLLFEYPIDILLEVGVNRMKAELTPVMNCLYEQGFISNKNMPYHEAYISYFSPFAIYYDKDFKNCNGLHLFSYTYSNGYHENEIADINEETGERELRHRFNFNLNCLETAVNSYLEYVYNDPTNKSYFEDEEIRLS